MTIKEDIITVKQGWRMIGEMNVSPTTDEEDEALKRVTEAALDSYYLQSDKSLDFKLFVIRRLLMDAGLLISGQGVSLRCAFTGNEVPWYGGSYNAEV